MIEWIKSKTGLLVPQIEGKTLSSAVNPEKEAAAWVRKVLKNISKETKTLFILGVGGKFHIEALQSQTDCNLVCIDIQEDFILSSTSTERVQYLHINKIEKVWEEVANSSINIDTYQVLVHGPSTCYASNMYLSIHMEVGLRTKGAIERHEKYMGSISPMVNISIPNIKEALNPKNIATHQKGEVHHANHYMWKILGEFIK